MVARGFLKEDRPFTTGGAGGPKGRRRDIVLTCAHAFARLKFERVTTSRKSTREHKWKDVLFTDCAAVMWRRPDLNAG